MERFIMSLLICSVQMSVISIIYIFLSYVLRNEWSAKRRYYLWLIILIGFLTPFKPFSGNPIYEIYLNEPVESIQTTNHIVNSEVLYPQTQFNATSLMFAIWVLGIVVLCTKYFINQYHFKKYLNRYSEPCDDLTFKIAESIAKELNIYRFRVVTLPGISTPMMIGFRYPTVILPESRYTETELRLIIKHEMFHFKKHDLLYKLVLIICRTVHWFNPLMVMIVREFERICELACDENVMLNENKSDRKTYCQTILSSVMPKNKNGNFFYPVVSSNFVADKHNLKHRLKLIVLNTKKKKFSFLCIIIMLITLLSGTVFGVSYKELDITLLSEDVIAEATTVVQSFNDTEVTAYPSDKYNDYEDVTSTAVHFEETTTPEQNRSDIVSTTYPAEQYNDLQNQNEDVTVTIPRVTKFSPDKESETTVVVTSDMTN